MRGRTARRKAAIRWVRRNRPSVSDPLPRMVERYVFLPMYERDGDLTTCPYFRGAGTCQGGSSCSYVGEPRCITDMPGPFGWPRQRMARGYSW